MRAGGRKQVQLLAAEINQTTQPPITAYPIVSATAFVSANHPLISRQHIRSDMFAVCLSVYCSPILLLLLLLLWHARQIYFNVLPIELKFVPHHPAEWIGEEWRGLEKEVGDQFGRVGVCWLVG